MTAQEQCIPSTLFSSSPFQALALENPKSGSTVCQTVYPYPNRYRWLAAGRYAHLLQALKGRGVRGRPILAARLKALRLWTRVRFVVLLLLSISLAATAGAWIARYLPSVQDTLDAINSFTALVGAASGLLTLAFLFLTRLLDQIEIDILLILIGQAEES